MQNDIQLQDDNQEQVLVNEYLANVELNDKATTKVILGLLLASYPDDRGGLIEQLHTTEFIASQAEKVPFPGFIPQPTIPTTGQTFRLRSDKIKPLIGFLEEYIDNAPPTVSNREKGVWWILTRCPTSLYHNYTTAVVSNEKRVSRSTFLKIVSSKYFGNPEPEDCFCSSCLQHILGVFHTDIPDLWFHMKKSIDTVNESHINSVLNSFLK